MLILDVARKADVHRVEFASDGAALVVCAVDHRAAVWSVADRRSLTAEKRPDFWIGSSAALHPSGRWLFGMGANGGPAVYDFQTRQTRGEPPGEWARMGRPRFTPDGKTVIYPVFPSNASTGHHLASRGWQADGTLGAGWTVPLDAERPETRWNTGLVMLLDGERFATSDFGMWSRGRVVVRSLATGAALATAYCPALEHPELAVAPDGSLFVAQAMRVLYIWRGIKQGAKNVQADRQVRNDGRKHFTAIAFHPSGKYLAATSNDTTVKLYDTITWQVARSFAWDVGRLRSVAFSPDGALAAVGGDKGKVVVWDVDL
jgi:WD40 repeat protein